MRFTSVLPLVLVAAPAAVSAVGTLGFALGTKNPDGSCKDTAAYEADLDVLKSLTSVIRGYDAADCNFAQTALPAAKSKGFKVVLGIWPDTDPSFNAGKAAVQAAVGSFADQIAAVTVGSESLYRGNFTGEELLAKIEDVKSVIGDIPIGTADSWNKYADGTADAVIRSPSVGILLINAFSYWQGQEINNASSNFFDDIYQALGRVQSVRGSLDGVDVKVGETGWPTEGDEYEAAVPSVENAQQFYQEGICGIRAWGVDVFAFEAFDEPWKPVSIGLNGQAADERHWGVFNEDRTPKYDVTC